LGFQKQQALHRPAGGASLFFSFGPGFVFLV
jgi:hypothetical protein